MFSLSTSTYLKTMMTVKQNMASTTMRGSHAPLPAPGHVGLGRTGDETRLLTLKRKRESSKYG